MAAFVHYALFDDRIIILYKKKNISNVYNIILHYNSLSKT